LTGIITKAYLTQMTPVAVRAKYKKKHGIAQITENHLPIHCYVPRFCDILSLSAGRERSLIPAATRHHFIIGAQKNIVLGPSLFCQIEDDLLRFQLGISTCRMVEKGGES
jgi:hypothetical protein